jgi:DNA-binding transcriptional LysR family regulator
MGRQGDLTGMEEFATVAQAGSFTAAAARLKLTKSVVSERVRALEIRLGCRLFDRSTRRVRLTEAGAVYLEHANRIRDEIRIAEGALQDLRQEPRGRLTVATTINGATLFLVPALAEFRARYRHIDLHIIADDAIVHPAHVGADVSIRFGTVDRPDWIARRIGGIDYILAASASYVAAHGAPRSPGDLAGHVCLPFRNQVPWVFRHGEQVVHEPRAFVSTDNGPVYRALVLGGYGIGMLNRLAVGPELASGAVVQLLPNWKIEGRDEMATWIVLPDNRAIPPKVRVFVDYIAERMAAVSA